MTNLCHCDQDLRRVGVEVSSTAASFFVSQLRIEPISFADDLRVFFSFYIFVRWIWTEFPGGWPIMHLRQTPRHSTFCQVRTAKCLSRGDWQFNLGSRLSQRQKISQTIEKWREKWIFTRVKKSHQTCFRRGEGKIIELTWVVGGLVCDKWLPKWYGAPGAK